ncbi:MAG TPA: GTPase [Thermoanaerobaculia bacterium]|nr:GTPase [Thermoanaerobaculia bacterium]
MAAGATMSGSTSIFATISELAERAIDRIPEAEGRSTRNELLILKELLMDARPPKLMILGRRGAGKSSLINAIFGEPMAAVGSVLSETGRPTWYSYAGPRGEMKILDTRGLGDRTRPESANFQDALDEIRAGLVGEWPDAILFLCKAKEVDSHIAQDLDNVQAVRAFLAEKHRYAAPVVAVVTQVDELDPKRVEPPYENETKQRNIETAVGAIQEALAERGIALARVIPVSTYAEYEGDRRVYDNYWHVEELVDYLVEVLPRTAQVQMARLAQLRGVQRKLARRMTGAAAAVAGGIAAAPIPVADILPITALQIGLISGIAYVSGRELSRKAAREFLVALGANVGAAFALREGARALAKIVFPGAGLAVSAGVAFAGTWGLGEAAIAYFIEKRPIEEARERFRRKKRETEAERSS